MPVITTYRTTDSVSTAEGQSIVLAKVSEFFGDINSGAFGAIDLVNLQMIGGRIYIHLSDAMNRSDIPTDYYNLEKASM